jgi:hypothetical protein
VRDDGERSDRDRSLRDRTQAVVLADESGLVRPGDGSGKCPEPEVR